MAIQVLVIVSPKPDKEARIGELVKYVVDSVKAHEPEVSEYHAHRTAGEDAGTIDFVMYMKIKDEEALVKRRELQHHKNIAKYVKDEDLLRRPMRYMKLEGVEGFSR